jgi:HEAT repeat protein
MASFLGNLWLIGGILATIATSYVVLGLIIDIVRALRTRVAAAIRGHLSLVLFADEEPAEAAAARLGRVSPRVLIPMVQRLAADLDGDADIRLHRLVSSSGLIGSISRRMRSRTWRRRAQAAALAPLFAEGDPRRVRLLDDPHPTVRARAAAHLEASDVILVVDRLLELLGDPNPAVRFAAQQALLRGDGRVVPHLAAYLEEEHAAGISWALEVAAAMPDPRLYAAITVHTRSEDPRRRAVAAEAIKPDEHGAFIIGEMLDDGDADVRAAAVKAAAGAGGETLAVRVGVLLADESWKVRLSAGQTLAALGPVGALTLRHHLFDQDPYARDMARRALDDIAAREGRPVLPAPIPPGLDPWPVMEPAA